MKHHFPVPPLLSLALLLTGAQGQAEDDSAERAKPNILILVASDLGWGDLGLQSGGHRATPRLDALAGQGVRLLRFHAAAEGSSGRAALLTGRYPWRAGVTGTTRGEQHLAPRERTLGHALGEAGWATGYFGSWHLGSNWPHLPQARGFAEFSGWTAGDEETAAPPLARASDAALEFMARQHEAGIPFFCLVSWPGWPGEPGEDAAASAAAELDGEAGRLLDWLDASGAAGSSVVWFLSANGPALDPAAPAARRNAHLRGGKGSVHEGGTRVPSLVRWPGVIPEGREFARLASALDLMPTLLDFCGVPGALHPPLDGLGLGPALRLGTLPARWPNRMLFHAWTAPGRDVARSSVSARTDRWVALRDPVWRAGPALDSHGGWELYDLSSDPFSRADLADDYPYLLGNMKADYSRWLLQSTRGLGPPAAVELGAAEWPRVTLLPRDAEEGGATWSIRVTAAGAYAAAAEPAPGAARLLLILEPGGETVELSAAEEAPGWLGGRIALGLGDHRITLRTLPESAVPPASRLILSPAP